jgi:hypothetical protein
MSRLKWTKAKPTEKGFYFVVGFCYHRTAPGGVVGPPTKLFDLVEFDYIGTANVEPTRGPFSREGWAYFAGPISSPNHDALTPP